jgi:hypothetical protein
VRVRLIALALLVGMVVPVDGALAAAPHHPFTRSVGIGVRLADVPADTRDPLARSYIVSRLAPETSIRRRVEIRNSTGSIADVAVYPAAAKFRHGAFAFASGHTKNELSGWTSVSRKALRLRPGTSAFETVTINVPKAASVGEHYAVVWAEVATTAPAGGGVQLVNRVGVRMYVSIGPGGARPSNFRIGALSAERAASGAPLVVANVRNSGRRTLDVSGNMTLSKGPGGLRAGPIQVTLGAALAPGDSETASVLLDKRLPRGPWRATLRLTSGLVQREATATITFPRIVGTAKPPASSPLIRIFFALLAVAALVLLLNRRSRSRGRGRFEPATTRD